MPKKYKSEMDHFDALTARCPMSGCWLWIGPLSSNGYGRWSIGKRATGIRSERAHRAAWRLFRGPIPDGMRVLHKCDVPTCVNPTHLFLGTDLDNVRDMDRKGRRKNPSQKLTTEDVLEIRRRHALGTINQKAIAREFSVNRAQIYCIVNRITWRNA